MVRVWGQVGESVRKCHRHDRSICKCIVLCELQCFYGRVNTDSESGPGNPCRTQKERNTAGSRTQIEHVNRLLRGRRRDRLGETKGPIFGFWARNQYRAPSEEVKVAKRLGALGGLAGSRGGNKVKAWAALPRIYCKGSPRIRLRSIVESGPVLFLGERLAWVSHFSSRRALSLPIRPERVVTS